MPMYIEYISIFNIVVTTLYTQTHTHTHIFFFYVKIRMYNYVKKEPKNNISAKNIMYYIFIYNVNIIFGNYSQFLLLNNVQILANSE